jgi:hypothetical protein
MGREKSTARRVAGVLAGLAIAGGSAAAWHFWHIDGALATMVSFGGLALVCNSLGFTDQF